MQNNKTNPANPANQPKDTPKAIDIPARPMPGRKIDAVTIAEMAKLCAKTLTESEACRRLGIKPRTWFDFKSRAGRTEHFAEMVEAYRAARIEQLIDRIEKSADGDGVKFPDWRAALALLKITDQRRFGDSPAPETPPQANPHIVQAMLDTVARMFAEREKQSAKALPPCKDVPATITVTNEN